MLEANGIKYFVKRHQKDQDKPNLILLHGFMGTGAVFEKLIAEIKPFCNPITIDLLGHGKTEKASSPNRFSTQNQVADLKEIISKINSSRSFLYGYSMGGRLALQFAAKNPRLLTGLILESTNPGLASEKERKKRIRLDEERAQSIENDFKAFLENWGALPLFENDSVNKKLRNRYHSIQQQNDSGQMAMCLRGFGTGQMPVVNFEKIDIPILLLAGSDDDKYINIAQTMNRKNGNSSLKIIPNAGHRVHLKKPSVVSNHIKEFLGRHLNL